LASAASAQPAPPPASAKPQAIVGEVTALDANAATLTLRTDAGASVSIVTDARTALLRARPGAKDLSGATPITLPEIAIGDRVLARGLAPDATNPLVARQLVLMTRADVAEKQARERDEWRRRGIVGVISSLERERGLITIEARSSGAAKTITIAQNTARAEMASNQCGTGEAARRNSRIGSQIIPARAAPKTTIPLAMTLLQTGSCQILFSMLLFLAHVKFSATGIARSLPQPRRGVSCSARQQR